jgi:hypothetical protein
MKTVNCTLEVVTTKKKATFNIYIQRTSDEIFNMGNSSFLVNVSKTVFKNGKLTFAKVKYCTGGYDVMEYVHYPFGAFGIQIRCNTLGKPISKNKEKIATVVYDYTGNPSNVTWRLMDTAVVTPAFETVDSTYFINLK